MILKSYIFIDFIKLNIWNSWLIQVIFMKIKRYKSASIQHFIITMLLHYSPWSLMREPRPFYVTLLTDAADNVSAA